MTLKENLTQALATAPRWTFVVVPTLIVAAWATAGWWIWRLSAKTADDDSAEVQVERYDTLLHAATLKGDVATVEYLLSQGCSVNAAVGDKACTALHVASAHGHVGVLQVLLARPELVMNPRDLDGNTPLHHAVITRDHRVIEMLLRTRVNVRGLMDQTDPEMKNSRGLTPLEMAESNGDDATAALLRKSTEEQQAEIARIQQEQAEAAALAKRQAEEERTRVAQQRVEAEARTKREAEEARKVAEEKAQRAARQATEKLEQQKRLRLAREYIAHNQILKAKGVIATAANAQDSDVLKQALGLAAQIRDKSLAKEIVGKGKSIDPNNRLFVNGMNRITGIEGLQTDLAKCLRDIAVLQTAMARDNSALQQKKNSVQNRFYYETVKETVRCDKCYGSGRIYRGSNVVPSSIPCTACSGRGTVVVSSQVQRERDVSAALAEISRIETALRNESQSLAGANDRAKGLKDALDKAWSFLAQD